MTQHRIQATTSHGPPRRLRRSRGRLLASGLVAVVTAVLLISGCTTPQVSPPPNTSGASTTQPVETTTPAPPPTTAAAIYKPATDQGPAENVPVPVLPENAKEFSEEGLVAFAEYWYSTLGYAFETGDPKPMLEVSDPSCKTCQAMAKAAIGGHAEGKWIKGGKMAIDPPRTAFAQMDDGTYQALAMARQEQVQYFNADKSLRKDLGVTVAQQDILVGMYVGEAWVAITVEHIAGSSGS